MKTFPLPSTATPIGRWNCPGPLPRVLQLVRKTPALSNLSMRVLPAPAKKLPASATKTFPLPSTATPSGSPKLVLHAVRKVPQGPMRSPMALRHASLSARAGPAATQPPSALSAVVVREFSIAWHAVKLSCALTSAASQRTSRLALVPRTLALADGHRPLPGSSPSNAATQVSTAASIAAAVPRQPPWALLMAISALPCALPRQVESTPAAAFFALA